MTNAKCAWQRMRWIVLLILSTSMMQGCPSMRLPESYVNTAPFLDRRPMQADSQAFAIEVKPFEQQLKQPLEHPQQVWRQTGWGQ